MFIHVQVYTCIAPLDSFDNSFISSVSVTFSCVKFSTTDVLHFFVLHGFVHVYNNNFKNRIPVL